MIKNCEGKMLRYHSNGQNTYSTNDHFPPISRTLRYKKVTKPLLERKRRARINRCLDELKDLVGALEADGENINKLEKADILELTVRHLKRISRLQDPMQEAHRFQAGFSQCASEACIFLGSLPGMNSTVGKRLIEHLKQSIFKHYLPAYVPAVPSVEPCHNNSIEQCQVSLTNGQFSPPITSSPKPSRSPHHRADRTTITTSSKSVLSVPLSMEDSNNNDTSMLLPASISSSYSPKNDDNFMWRPW